MHGGRDARAPVRAARWAASSRACSRTTAWRSTAATSSSASRARTGACASVVTKGGLDARLRHGGRGRRRDARRDARPLGRAGARRGGRSAVLGRPRELGARDLRRRRHLRVREPDPRQAAAHRALGRGLQPGQDRRAQHARPRRGARRDPLLLLRPRRLGLDGVRGAGLGRPGGARLARRRRVQRPSTSTRAARSPRAVGRPLGRPRARAPLHLRWRTAATPPPSATRART